MDTDKCVHCGTSFSDVEKHAEVCTIGTAELNSSAQRTDSSKNVFQRMLLLVQNMASQSEFEGLSKGNSDYTEARSIVKELDAKNKSFTGQSSTDSSLEDRLLEASIGSCTCNTKSDELDHHKPLCHYRLLTEAFEYVDGQQSLAMDLNLLD